MASAKTYVQVIVPLKLDWEPFYALDGEESVGVGDFVAVSFAGRRYIGAVSAVSYSLPEGMNPSSVREIYSVHPEITPLTAVQIEFWRQIAGYYMCTLGEVLKMACPSSRSTYTSPRKGRAVQFAPVAPGVQLTQEAVDYRDLTEGSLGEKPVLLCAGMNIEALASLCFKKIRPDGAEHGKNVLWLVPDTLTLKKIEEKLRPIFGSKLLVFSSEMTPARRRDLESALHSCSDNLILGTRAALFLPFSSLALAIVQEEHSQMYKQSGIAPRFNARDAAVMLAGVHGADLLLQSPTPSLESVFNCRNRKFKKLCIGPSPETLCECLETVVVDTKAELRKNGMVGDVPKMLLPQWSGETMTDIAFVKLPRAVFPKSEDLEPQLLSLFGKDCFYSDDTVSKPLPSDIRTLCVFGIDSLLSRNDFRADERALQELYKVLEPCRGSLQKLVILTRQPSHSVLRATGGDSSREGLFDTSRLMAERKDLALPPFSRIVDIRLKDEKYGVGGPHGNAPAGGSHSYGDPHGNAFAGGGAHSYGDPHGNAPAGGAHSYGDPHGNAPAGGAQRSYGDPHGNALAGGAHSYGDPHGNALAGGARRSAQLRQWLSEYLPSVASHSYPIMDGWRVILPKDRTLLEKKRLIVENVLKAEKSCHCINSVYFDVDP